MKRIFLACLSMIIFLLLGIHGTVNATTAIAWSEMSVSLNTLNLYATDSLEIDFDKNIENTLFSARTEIYLEDLSPSSFGGYWTYKNSKQSLALNFTASGSGYLDASVEYAANINTLNWAVPDESGGEDFTIFLYIHNQSSYRYDMRSHSNDGFPYERTGEVDTRYGNPSFSPVFFEDGGAGTIEIYLESYLHTQYDCYPQPVPEPSTILLLGSGLLGLAGVSRKKN